MAPKRKDKNREYPIDHVEITKKNFDEVQVNRGYSKDRSAWDKANEKYITVTPTCSSLSKKQKKTIKHCHRKVNITEDDGVTPGIMHRVGNASQVVRGVALETGGKLQRPDFVKITKDYGDYTDTRVVSKKRFENGRLNPWANAVKQAREELGLEHAMVLIKKPRDKAGNLRNRDDYTDDEARLYARAKKIHARTKATRERDDVDEGDDDQGADETKHGDDDDDHIEYHHEEIPRPTSRRRESREETDEEDREDRPRSKPRSTRRESREEDRGERPPSVKTKKTTSAPIAEGSAPALATAAAALAEAVAGIGAVAANLEKRLSQEKPAAPRRETRGAGSSSRAVPAPPPRRSTRTSEAEKPRSRSRSSSRTKTPVKHVTRASRVKRATAVEVEAPRPRSRTPVKRVIPATSPVRRVTRASEVETPRSRSRSRSETRGASRPKPRVTVTAAPARPSTRSTKRAEESGVSTRRSRRVTQLRR